MKGILAKSPNPAWRTPLDFSEPWHEAFLCQLGTHREIPCKKPRKMALLTTWSNGVSHLAGF
jgi:hypothetical protein